MFLFRKRSRKKIDEPLILNPDESLSNEDFNEEFVRAILFCAIKDETLLAIESAILSISPQLSPTQHAPTFSSLC